MTPFNAGTASNTNGSKFNGHRSLPRTPSPQAEFRHSRFTFWVWTFFRALKRPNPPKQSSSELFNYSTRACAPRELTPRAGRVRPGPLGPEGGRLAAAQGPAEAPRRSGAARAQGTASPARPARPTSREPDPPCFWWFTGKPPN